MMQTLETIEDLGKVNDGNIAFDFKCALAELVADLREHDGDPKPRKLAVTVTAKPMIDKEGRCYGFGVLVAVESKLPGRLNAAYLMNVDEQGLLQFSDGSPDDPKQRTLDEMAGDGDEKPGRKPRLAKDG